jgi:hypothetical protein
MTQAEIAESPIRNIRSQIKIIKIQLKINIVAPIPRMN